MYTYNIFQNVPVSYWINPAERLVQRSLQKWRSKLMKADNTSCMVVLIDPLGPRKLSILKKKREEHLGKLKDKKVTSPHKNISGPDRHGSDLLTGIVSTPSHHPIVPPAPKSAPPKLGPKSPSKDERVWSDLDLGMNTTVASVMSGFTPSLTGEKLVCHKRLSMTPGAENMLDDSIQASTVHSKTVLTPLPPSPLTRKSHRLTSKSPERNDTRSGGSGAASKAQHVSPKGKIESGGKLPHIFRDGQSSVPASLFKDSVKSIQKRTLYHDSNLKDVQNIFDGGRVEFKLLDTNGSLVDRLRRHDNDDKELKNSNNSSSSQTPSIPKKKKNYSGNLNKNLSSRTSLRLRRIRHVIFNKLQSIGKHVYAIYISCINISLTHSRPAMHSFLQSYSIQFISLAEFGFYNGDLLLQST